MAENKHSDPPNLKQELPISFTTGFLFMAAVLLALPISQLITEFTGKSRTEVEVVDYKPPPVIEEPPPEQEEEEQDDIDDIEENREPPTLEQLEISMAADLSGFASSDFTVPTIDVGGQIEQMVYELEDLTQAPRPTYQRAPVHPPEMKRAGISGTVRLEFVVTAEGTTRSIKVIRSTNPAFEENAIRAVRKWRFQPGEKDGKAVDARVRIPISFSVGN